MRSKNNAFKAWDRSDGKTGKKKFKNKRIPMDRFSIYKRAGQQALRDVNALRRFVNTELHYIDSTASTALSTTPSFFLLNGCAPGDTATTRTGQSIKVDELDLRFALSVNATAVVDHVRILVIIDKQPNATQFAIADLLPVTNVVAPYTDGSQQRFIPVYDVTLPLSIYNTGAFFQRVRLPNKFHTTYNTGTAGTVADIVSYSYYLVAFSDQTTNTPTMLHYARTWFVDN